MAFIPPYQLRKRRAGSYHEADTFPDGPATSALEKAVTVLNQEAFLGDAVARVDALLTAAIYGQSDTLVLVNAVEHSGTRADVDAIAKWFYSEAVTARVPLTIKRCQLLANRFRALWPHCIAEEDSAVLRQCVLHGLMAQSGSTDGTFQSLISLSSYAVLRLANSFGARLFSRRAVLRRFMRFGRYRSRACYSRNVHIDVRRPVAFDEKPLISYPIFPCSNRSMRTSPNPWPYSFCKSRLRSQHSCKYATFHT
jgi:hypothetical protein